MLEWSFVVVVPVVMFVPVGRLRQRGGQMTKGRAKARGQAPQQKGQEDKGSYRAKSEKRPQGKRKKREGHAREEENGHKNL